LGPLYFVMQSVLLSTKEGFSNYIVFHTTYTADIMNHNTVHPVKFSEFVWISEPLNIMQSLVSIEHTILTKIP